MRSKFMDRFDRIKNMIGNTPLLEITLKYKGKEMMRYTYEIKNYPNYDGKVMAYLLVYRGKVVGEGPLHIALYVR